MTNEERDAVETLRHLELVKHMLEIRVFIMQSQVRFDILMAERCKCEAKND
jgi:hypothetical protein